MIIFSRRLTGKIIPGFFVMRIQCVEYPVPKSVNPIVSLKITVMKIVKICRNEKY